MEGANVGGNGLEITDAITYLLLTVQNGIIMSYGIGKLIFVFIRIVLSQKHKSAGRIFDRINDRKLLTK